MNKKNILKMILLLIIGGIVGAIVSIAMFNFEKTDGIGILKDLGYFLKNHNLYLFTANILIFFIPSLVIYSRGKKLYITLETLDEEEMDAVEVKAQRNLDLALTINGVFMILNFMIFGATFDPKSSLIVWVLIIFLVNTLLTASLEIVAINMIKKFNPRIKGDPTDFSFQKDYLNSCDEAEQLKIYKIGYHAFITTKNSTLILIIVSLLLNMVFETGILPIVMLSILMMIQTISYGYKALKFPK